MELLLAYLHGVLMGLQRTGHGNADRYDMRQLFDRLHREGLQKYEAPRWASQFVLNMQSEYWNRNMGTPYPGDVVIDLLTVLGGYDKPVMERFGWRLDLDNGATHVIDPHGQTTATEMDRIFGPNHLFFFWDGVSLQLQADAEALDRRLVEVRLGALYPID